MESNILIKTTSSEMEDFFIQNDVCLVKFYKMREAGIYEVLVRHAERKNHLRGTFTIPHLIAILSVEKENG